VVKRLALLACLAATLAHAGEPEPRLPDSLDCWNAVAETEVFRGDELFLYINGGAEIYHEYGFEEVTVRDYRRGEDRIGVEVYRMSGSAFGIFSFMRTATAERMDLGDGGSFSGYFASFWADRDLVVVTAHSEFDGVREAVPGLARDLSERFPAGGGIPSLVAELPEEGRIDGSEKYLAGPIALRNESPRMAGLFRGFREAALARYLDPPRTVYLFVWSDEEQAREALRQAGEQPGLEREGRRVRVVQGGDR
jgi:hypothetical protein